MKLDDEVLGKIQKMFRRPTEKERKGHKESRNNKKSILLI